MALGVVASLPQLGLLASSLWPNRHQSNLRATTCCAAAAVDWITEVLDPTEADRWAVAGWLQDQREASEEDRTELTYGEYGLDSFLELLDASIDGLPEVESLTFCDLGSGAGRLVLAAAARYPWARCVGIEVLPQLHQMAGALEQVAVEAAAATGNAMSPCEFRQLEVTTESAPEALAGIDVVFAFSTCFEDVTLAATLAAGLRPGARVCTIDSMLPSRGDAQLSFRLLRRLDVAEHAAYLWEVSAQRPDLWIDYAVLS